jgi:hypothetical protein
MSLHIKNSGNAKLALIMAAVLFLIWLVQPTVSEWLGQGQNSESIQKTQQNPSPLEPNQAATPTVPALMPGADPFKAHIEKNGLAPNLAPNLAPVHSSNSQKNTASTNHSLSTNATNQAGVDPFKAFLEKQKQQSKDAGISPFGK